MKHETTRIKFFSLILKQADVHVFKQTMIISFPILNLHSLVITLTTTVIGQTKQFDVTGYHFLSSHFSIRSTITETHNTGVLCIAYAKDKCLLTVRGSSETWLSTVPFGTQTRMRHGMQWSSRQRRARFLNERGRTVKTLAGSIWHTASLTDWRQWEWDKVVGRQCWRREKWQWKDETWKV